MADMGSPRVKEPQLTLLMAQSVEMEALAKQITGLSHDFLTLRGAIQQISCLQSAKVDWSRTQMRSMRDFSAF